MDLGYYSFYYCDNCQTREFDFPKNWISLFLPSKDEYIFCDKDCIIEFLDKENLEELSRDSPWNKITSRENID